MKLTLIGHEYKYAVEQIMLTLFPEEKPVYPVNCHTGDAVLNQDVLSAESRLTIGTVYAHATTIIQRNGISSRGSARIKRDKLKNKLMTDRLLQKIIKQSFYRAAIDFLESPPVWGSLTGIRPAQIAAGMLESGRSIKSTVKTLTDEFYVSPERAEMCVRTARSALSLKNRLDWRDIALYISIPFCPTRCAYCSFVSNSVERSFDLIEPFTNTLLREIEETAAAVRTLGLRVIAIYIGGGTPTALPADALESVMLALDKHMDLSNLREYTVEAGRPDTVTSRHIDIISRSRADRICINPQSMSDDVLNAIGRKHTAADILKAVGLVRQTGSLLNMDIIAGLPGDTLFDFRQTLDTVLDLNPENITVHTLSLKKGSRITLEGTVLPGEDAVAGMLGYASQRLYENGYEPYYLYRQKFTSGGFENTGWSLPGRDCIYNICMMEELCTVLSLGAGGVTKLVSGGGRIERIFNAKYPREYIMQKSPDEAFTRHMDHKTGKIIDFYSNLQ